MRAASKDSQGRNLVSRETGIFGLQPGEDVNAQDSLGGLVTSGALERFVKQPQTLGRQASSLAWLAAVKGGASWKVRAAMEEQDLT